MNFLRLLVVTEPGTDGVFGIVDSLIKQIHRCHPRIRVDLAYSSCRIGVGMQRLIKDVMENGGDTLDLKVRNAPSPADIRAIAALRGFIVRRKHHVVHAHSSKAGALTRIAQFSPPYSRFPTIIYQPHAYYGMRRKRGLKETFYNSVESFLGRYGITVCCSEDEEAFATEVLNLPRRKISVVHNGIDTSRFSPPDPTEKKRCREALGLPDTGKLLGTVGRASEQKNHRALYDSLEGILPTAEWEFCHAGKGSGKLREGLTQNAAVRCHTFEHLEDIASFFKAIDGLVMGSLYEGLSLSLLEGMSCGIPVMVPDAPGFHFLRNYDFSQIHWLPNPNKRNDFDDALKDVLAAWGKVPRITLTRQSGRVRELFSHRTQMERLISLYEKS